MYSFSMAAMTNDHTISVLNNTGWLSYSSGGHKSWTGYCAEIKVSQGSVPL